MEETSQVVDLRTLGALVDRRPQPPQLQAVSRGPVLPEFTGSLLPPPPIDPTPGFAAAVHRGPTGTSRREIGLWMYAVVAALGLALLSMTAYVVLAPPQVVVVERTPFASP